MRIVDLSHDVEHQMVTYPGLPGPVVADHLSREASRGRYAEGVEFHIARIEMVANTGTYLDVPSHRWAGADDLAAVGIERVAGLPGRLVDAAGLVAVDAAALDPTGDVTGCAVLLRTGWDRHWRTPAYGDPGAPYLTEGGAQALVDRGAVLVGIDSVNIDAMHDTSRPAHSILLRAGVLIVEHLTRLDLLDGAEFTFTAAPVKVRGMGTFPVRAFATMD